MTAVVPMRTGDGRMKHRVRRNEVFMKVTKKILIGLVSCSMILSGGAVTPTASAKSTKVVKKGYTISKKAGKYSGSVKVKVKAKKGYTVYYTTTGKLKKSHRIKASKSKTFTFKQTKTLRIYVVKASKKMTAKKLRKVKKSAMAKYKYTIIKQTTKSTTVPSANTATASPSATTAATTTAPSATQTPSVTATPVKTPAATATAIPMVTPGASDYVGDDSSADYVEPTRTTYTEEDTDTSSENATEITLSTSATGSKVTADNYEISKKNKLTITAPGTYVLHSATNETTDGLVEVKYADDTMTGTVHIILDGVRLTSSNNTAPDSDTGLITIKSNVTNAVITIADGSENTLTDTGATGIDADDNTTTYTAGIVSKKTPLTINGSGTLNIISTNGNGIKCTDELKILDAVINASGPDDTALGHNGISGKTGLSFKNATIYVHANNDALKTTLDADDVAADSTLADLGNMELDGGSYTIVSENGDGISAYRTLYLNPTLLNVTTKNAASSTTDGSYKGVKAGTTIYVPSTAGTITADTTATYSSSRASRDNRDTSNNAVDQKSPQNNTTGHQDNALNPQDNSKDSQSSNNDNSNNSVKPNLEDNKENPPADPKTGQDQPEPPHDNMEQPDKHDEFTAETPFQTRYCYVQYNTEGKVTSVSVDHIAAINEKQAKKYANKIKNRSAKKGFIDIYRYRITTNDTGTLYLFMDCQKEWNSFRGTLYTSILLSVAGMAAVFVLVFFFSHLFLRPVEESYTKQKQFITDAGHELKTPLTIIDANTEVLEMEHGVSDWTKSIRNQVERLSSMVQQLITLSKMDEDGTTADKQTFCLSNALAESTDLFIPVATTSGKQIQLQLEEQLYYLGDEKCIRQMFCLLLDNAVKYANENSVIMVTLKKKGRKTFFEIQNDCTNLEKGDQSVLFERFYRSD